MNKHDSRYPQAVCLMESPETTTKSLRTKYSIERATEMQEMLNFGKKNKNNSRKRSSFQKVAYQAHVDLSSARDSLKEDAAPFDKSNSEIVNATEAVKSQLKVNKFSRRNTKYENDAILKITELINSKEKDSSPHAEERKRMSQSQCNMARQTLHLHSLNKRPRPIHCWCCNIFRKKQKNKIHINSTLYHLDSDQKKENIKNLWQSACRKVILFNKVVKVMEIIKEENKGNHKELSALEERNTHKIPFYVILPESKFSMYWGLILLLLMLYTGVAVPLRLSFFEEIEYAWEIFELVVDGLFGVDMIINLLTAYYDEDELLVTDSKKICLKYLKSWFLSDFFACFPFQFFKVADDQYNKALRLLRLPRIYRLIRIVKLFRILRVVRKNKNMEGSFSVFIHSGTVRLAKLGCLVFFIIHFFACIWYMFAKMTDFEPDCWVVRYNMIDSSNWDLYIAAVYWVVQTLTTVGYGDIHARATVERLLSLIVMLFGVVFYSFTIGNLSSLLTKMDNRELKLQTKFLTLTSFGKQAKLPGDLMLKIKKQIQHDHDNLFSASQQENILKCLPVNLKAEILTYTHKKLLQTIRFFFGKNPTFLWNIFPLLKPLRLKKNQILFRRGDYAEELYFVLHGTVSLIDENGLIFKKYSKGSYFGEYEVLYNLARKISAMADNETELVYIKKKDLGELLNQFPDVLDELISRAEFREKVNKDAVAQAQRENSYVDLNQKKQLDNTASNLFNITNPLRALVSSRIHEEDLAIKTRRSSTHRDVPNRLTIPTKSNTERRKSMVVPVVKFMTLNEKNCITETSQKSFTPTQDFLEEVKKNLLKEKSSESINSREESMTSNSIISNPNNVESDSENIFVDESSVSFETEPYKRSNKKLQFLTDQPSLTEVKRKPSKFKSESIKE